MAYVTKTEARLLSGLTTDDITDSNLSDIIDYATAQLNADVNYIKEHEEVEMISSEKQNKINGSNKIFYARDVHKNIYEVGDKNNDGVVDANDIDVYTIDADGNRTTYTVSSLDNADIGKFTLSSAPSEEAMYITYAVAPLDESTPHQLIKTACAQLTAAFAFTRIDASKLGSFKIGKITINKQTEGFVKLYNAYQKTVSKINAQIATSGKAVDPIEETSAAELRR